MCIISWTIDIRMNIQIWLLYRRYKSEWYNFWWATIQDIAACACKVWTLFGQACGQEECSQTTMTMMTTTTTTDKSWLHRLATDILSWAKKGLEWQVVAQRKLYSYIPLHKNDTLMNHCFIYWLVIYCCLSYSNKMTVCKLAAHWLKLHFKMGSATFHCGITFAWNASFWILTIYLGWWRRRNISVFMYKCQKLVVQQNLNGLIMRSWIAYWTVVAQ